MNKTESIMACLETGPKTPEQIERATGLTNRQIHNLMIYKVRVGLVEKKAGRYAKCNSVQRKINEAVAFLESHGYEFD